MQNISNKRLSALTGNINILYSNGIDPLISGIAYDSRAVRQGFLFIALPGLHVDGHRFIKTAVDSGASAVMYSDVSFDTRQVEITEGRSGDVAFIRIENTRTAMASVAAEFYNRPADSLTAVGVTGTDGKTSTVYFIDQLLELSGFKSGFISTAACKTASIIGRNPYRQSTPEAVEINMLLSQMLENEKTHGVIEATSHGLSPLNNRLGEISFDAAVFTNISHEHLEFHGTFEQYRDDKANLFRKLKTDGFGIVNLDDANSVYFIDAAPGKRVHTCSLKDQNADFYACEIETSSSGSNFSIVINSAELASGKKQKVKTSIGLPGLFNIENALEAFAAVLQLTGSSSEKLARLLPELSAVKGRMKIIDCGQPFTAIVDYAHTPGSFERLFPDMRAQTPGRLIAVFGSAGERDVEKRPVQGKIAAVYADILVLTDEDPRGDDAMRILEEIASGAESAMRANMAALERGKNIFLIPDRYSAIKQAFKFAGKDDTVLLLGKGHESSIIYDDGAHPWDEQSAAEKVLAEIGYRQK